MPNVSVIIPTYNRERFIREAVVSALEQSYRDFEVIVIDDGSTDATGEIIHSLGSDRVRYVYQANTGRSAARNRGLREARGRYIAFLDSDDLYLKEKLALQVQFMDRHPQFGMVYTSAYCIDENGARLKHTYEASAAGRIYEQIAFFRPVTITLPTVMLRREVVDAVGNFDERMTRFEDTDYWRRVSKQHQIGALPDYTCEVRSHKENELSAHEPSAIRASVMYYIEKVLRDDTAVPQAVRRQGAGRLCLHYAEACLSQRGFRDEGKALFAAAFCYWPTNPRLLYAFLRYLIFTSRKR